MTHDELLRKKIAQEIEAKMNLHECNNTNCIGRITGDVLEKALFIVRNTK